ncbi:MAG: hypothetical protein M0Q51_00605 [Bacteroidales bacterium]|nr:hypothetical protein [Bacteroidales bacterium]
MLFMFAGLTFTMQGQYTGANARLEKDNLQIGDQVTLELTVTVPAGSLVQWPMLLDTLVRNIEILRKSGLDTITSNKEQFTLKQKLIITSFDSGSYIIPPIPFKYTQKGDTVTYYTQTSPVNLDVQTIKTDPAKDIKPIKPPLAAPVTFRELLPWIGLGVIILALAFLIYFFLKKRKQKVPVFTSRLKTSIPPYEAAMEALESLRLKKLWQAGRVKEYYSEMTDIVREYIELRFPVRALEMTTSEIDAALRQTDVNSSAREKLHQTLVLADLVKFAKEQPLPLENDLSFSQSVDFVRETRPRKETEPLQAEKAENVEQNIMK